ncbi:MAG: D-alanine--D-alanine ligase family protein [Desulfomonilaceae bacterium]
MKFDRTKIALLFGGRSAEHEVSLRSARSIFEGLDRDKYHVIPILITMEGSWYIRPEELSSFESGAELDEKSQLMASADPALRGLLRLNSSGGYDLMPVDIVFPVLHGTFGEDGTVQGLLELANLPYVGCGVLASSVGMDKVVMKAAFRDIGLAVGPFFWFLRSEWKKNPDKIMKKLRSSRFPVFVKPANLGSSVGISRVTGPSGFKPAVDIAASYDRKILVEDGINGRELEISVLGNDEPIASQPGEVISHAEFYDYEEKYLQDTAELKIPAELPQDIIEAARNVAITAFRAVDGSGLARVDLFLTKENKVIVNEINTMPGFTSISMYPKLWEASGLSYPKLLDRLLELALERHQDKQEIRTAKD